VATFTADRSTQQCRLGGELTEIRATQLRFTLETRELLAASAIALPESSVAVLAERTDGASASTWAPARPFGCSLRQLIPGGGRLLSDVRDGGRQPGVVVGLARRLCVHVGSVSGHVDRHRDALGVSMGRRGSRTAYSRDVLVYGADLYQAPEAPTPYRQRADCHRPRLRPGEFARW